MLVSVTFIGLGAAIFVTSRTAQSLRTTRPVAMCTSSEESEEAYLARHPTLKADLLAALDHALSTRAEDPRHSMAEHLLGASSSPVLPAPNRCPLEGLRFNRSVPERAHAWVLWWNHFSNLDHSNENVLAGMPLSELPQSSYPVRMAASAGFRREWSRAGGEDSSIGQQTSSNLRRVDPRFDLDGNETAHNMVGVLVPLTERCFQAASTQLEQRGMLMHQVPVDHFEWLGTDLDQSPSHE